MRGLRIASLVAAVALAGLAGHEARADTLVLQNGDRLHGELQLTELPVVTSTGIVKVSRGEVFQVTLGTLAGDALQLRAPGRALYGMVDLPSYTIRLPGGQTVVVERARVGVLRFTGK